MLWHAVPGLRALVRASVRDMLASAFATSILHLYGVRRHASVMQGWLTPRHQAVPLLWRSHCRATRLLHCSAPPRLAHGSKYQNTTCSLFRGADVAGQHNAGVGVDLHTAAHHPDCRADPLPQAALEGTALLPPAAHAPARHHHLALCQHGLVSERQVRDRIHRCGAASIRMPLTGRIYAGKAECLSLCRCWTRSRRVCLTA